jgi:myo-inositol 2-dehydrogenase/D-chiro-inositol 1-dehydrogenase
VIDNRRKAAYGYDQHVEVFGSKGLLSAGNETPDRHVYSNTEGVQGPLPLYFFLERYTESCIVGPQSFVDCLANDTTPEVSGIDGRISIVMGLAARRSYEEKRPVGA